MTTPWMGGLIMNMNLRNLSVDERIRLVGDRWDSIAEDHNALPHMTLRTLAEICSALDCLPGCSVSVR